MQPAVDDRVAVHQQLAPVGEKLRVVVLTFAVRLQSRVEEDADWRRGERAGLGPSLRTGAPESARRRSRVRPRPAQPAAGRRAACRAITDVPANAVARTKQRDANLHDHSLLQNRWILGTRRQSTGTPRA